MEELEEATSYLTLAVDVVEWLCQESLEARSPAIMQSRIEQVHKALMRLDNVHTYGRLYNRLQIIALIQDVCAHDVVRDDEDNDDNDESEEYEETLSEYSSDQWSMIREQLILLKSLLLRKDADALVFPDQVDGKVVEDVTRPPRDYDLDVEKSNDDVFQEKYKDVLVWLDLHATVAKFREALQTLISDSNRPQNSRTRSRHSKSESVLLKKLEIAVDEYKKSLNEVLGDAQDSPTQYTLTSFLLHDLYTSHSQSDSTHQLPQRLLNDIDKAMSSHDEPHSYASLQAQLQDLLRSWSDTILTKPTLVLLGYGKTQDKVSAAMWEEGTRALMDQESQVDTREQATETHATQTEPEPTAVIGTQTEQSPTASHATQTQEQEEQPIESQGTQTEQPPSPVNMPTEQEPPCDDDDSVETQPFETQDDDAFLTQPPPSPPMFESQETPQQSLDTPQQSTSQEESVSLLPSQSTQSSTKKTPTRARQEEVDEEDNESEPSVAPAERTATVNESEEENRQVTDTSPRDAPETQSPLTATNQNVQNGKPKKRRNSTGSVPARRQRRKIIEWSDSSEDDEETIKVRKSFSPRKPSNMAPKQQSRRRYTELEKEAIRAGVKRFGVGAWKEIRSFHEDVLKSRTTVNIKDCYRTMLKKGEA